MNANESSDDDDHAHSNIVSCLKFLDKIAKTHEQIQQHYGYKLCQDFDSGVSIRLQRPENRNENEVNQTQECCKSNLSPEELIVENEHGDDCYSSQEVERHMC